MRVVLMANGPFFSKVLEPHESRQGGKPYTLQLLEPKGFARTSRTFGALYSIMHKAISNIFALIFYIFLKQRQHTKKELLRVLFDCLQCLSQDFNMLFLLPVFDCTWQPRKVCSGPVSTRKFKDVLWSNSLRRWSKPELKTKCRFFHL